MKIALYGSRSQECHLDGLKSLLASMSRQGIDVVMHEKLYRFLLHAAPLSLECVRRVVADGDFTADAALSLGGDGTFLRTAAWVGDKHIPVLGVNTGHLGYLTGISLGCLSQIDFAVLFDPGVFRIEQRTLLHVTSPSLACPYALNEVAVVKSGNASMTVTRVTLDGGMLADYRADGLLVATPTGSTAYNLSAGGPILAPDTPAFVISPIAPHALSMRPVVVADNAVITLTVSSRASSFKVCLDGRVTHLDSGSEITLRKAPFLLNILVPGDHFFASALRTKLNWGADVRDSDLDRDPNFEFSANTCPDTNSGSVAGLPD